MSNKSMGELPGSAQRAASPRLARSVSLAALLLAACSTDDPSSGASSGGTSGDPSTGDGALDGGGPGPSECGPAPVSSGEFTKRALLTAASDCALWHYCQFDVAATRLQRDIQAYVAEGSDVARDGARAAWREAMITWARAELFQFGPAGSRAHDPYHGASFRDRIYSWPSTSRCRVEEQLINAGAAPDFDQVLVSGKGLFALEYLLFYPGSDTACAPTSTTASEWAALEATELARRKREYALAVSGNVTSLARELWARWAPKRGNFRQTLIDAVGYEKAGSDRDQEALNVVAWSLVYGEKEIKDWKVGPFTGKVLPPAPVDGFEAPYADLSQELVVANLEGLQSLYQGCGAGGQGIGFDDWLVAAGHGDLASDIDAALAGALAAARDFPPFSEATEEEFASLYDGGIKPLTDLLKNELMAGNGSALNLSLPAGAAADND